MEAEKPLSPTRAAFRRLLYWDVIARLFVANALWQQGWLSLFSPVSLASQLIAQAPPGGGQINWVGWMMLVVASIITIDVLVNDVMPDRYQLRCTRKFHHLLYMLPGAAFLAQALIATLILYDTDWMIPLIYVFRACVCALVAWRFAIGRFGLEERRSYNRRGHRGHAKGRA